MLLLLLLLPKPEKDTLNDTNLHKSTGNGSNYLIAPGESFFNTL